MKEIWKDVPVKPFNKYYMVSNLGRIKSAPHKVRCRNGRIYPVRGQILRAEHPHNYHMVSLCSGYHSHEKKLQVHRLVAKAFIKNPHNLPMVNHKDENKQNNNVNNLEWCDCKYNVNYGTAKEQIGKKNSLPITLIDKKTNHEYDFDSESKAAKWLKEKLNYKRPMSHLICYMSAVIHNKQHSCKGFYVKQRKVTE